MRRAALLLLAALVCTTCVSCTPAEEPQPEAEEAEQSSEATTPAESSSDDHSELFEAWREQPQHNHDRAMAMEIASDGYLIGMSFGEVTDALGRYDASGIPLQTVAPGEEPPSVTGGIVYEIEDGGGLDIKFVDDIATSAEYYGLSSQEELDLSGEWLVEGGIRLEKLEFQGGGGLIRWIRPKPDAALRKGFGNWWMLEPGKLVFYDMNFDEPDVASVYRYRESDGVLTLNWIDEEIDPSTSKIQGRAPVSGEWIAGESQPTLSLVRP